MLFSHLLGNPLAKQQISVLLEEEKLPHTLLFSGPKGVGKSLFARALGEKLLRSAKTHPPDLHLYEPEGKSSLHPIETIRTLLDEVALPPFEAPAKLFILEAAERMLPYSSNALLKTLEEPPQDTYFILLTEDPSELLPTLLSRCTHIRFFPVPQEEIVHFLQTRLSLTRDQAEAISLRAEGSVAKALLLAEKKELKLKDLVKTAFTTNNLAPLLETLTDDATDELFEEIALFFRDAHPAYLRQLLPLLAECRLARERHTKLSVALQALLLKTHQKIA